MNAADAARATVMANGYGDSPRCAAMARATGAISTAMAVLEMNMPSNAVTAKIAASTTRGPASPTPRTSRSAANSTPPVRCSASENGSMPTISTRLGQWMQR